MEPGKTVGGLRTRGVMQGGRGADDREARNVGGWEPGRQGNTWSIPAWKPHVSARTWLLESSVSRGQGECVRGNGMRCRRRAAEVRSGLEGAWKVGGPWRRRRKERQGEQRVWSQNAGEAVAEGGTAWGGKAAAVCEGEGVARGIRVRRRQVLEAMGSMSRRAWRRS